MLDEVRQARQELLRVGLLGDLRIDGVVPDHRLSWRRSIGNSADGSNPARASPRSTLIPSLVALSTRCSTAGSHIWPTQGPRCSSATGPVRSWLAGPAIAVSGDDSTACTLQRGSTTPKTQSEPTASALDGGEAGIARFGSQHYNDALATLACAAAPVCTPSGSVIGRSVGGPIETANPLMLSLTREIGQQIEERLRSSRLSARPCAGDVVHAVHELPAPDGGDGQRRSWPTLLGCRTSG
jgi:hypothetical protein